MRVSRLVTLAVIFATPAAAAIKTSPQQFDLVCKGSSQLREGYWVKPSDMRLRVNLVTKRWCQDDCMAIHDIAEIQPGQIWFEKASQAEEAQSLINFSEVDRDTGSFTSVHQYMIVENKEGTLIKSQCEPAPFSGFPRIKTKF